jgi:hypothetical protein
MEWLEALEHKEMSGGVEMQSQRKSEPRVVLSHEEFAAAVRDALKNIARPQVLGSNPLVGCRWVMSRLGSNGENGTPVRALQTAIIEAAESLKRTPREQRFYNVLYHAYLHAAPTQEKAAELLDLPFSTFRRHLKEGIDRLTEILWQKEVGL